MMKTQPVKRFSGFTLIETVIIMVIVGLVVATVLPRIIKGIKKETFIEGKETLRAAREEVFGSILENCCLPNATVDDPLSHVADRWKAGVIYRPDPHLTCTFLDNENEALDDATSSLMVSTSSEPMAFIVASAGEDRTFDDLNNIETGNPVQIKALGDGGFDDLIDYVTLSYVKSKASCPTPPGGGEETPSEGDITFEEDMADFVDNDVGEGWLRGGDGIEIDGIEMNLGTHGGGPLSNWTNGCIWYQGNEAAGSCSNGVCLFGKGVRVYFNFKITGGNTDGGFTFSVISASHNTVSSCGGWYEGSLPDPEYLAYAGYNYDSSVGLQPPKIGLEFDFFRNYPSGTCWYGISRNDVYGDHVGFVYWGSGASYSCGNRAADNRHGTGSGLDPTSYPYTDNEASDDGLSTTDLGGHSFFLGSNNFCRLEIARDATSHTYVVKAWVGDKNDEPENMNDLSQDYSAVEPTVWNDFILEANVDQNFETILMGFTQSTGVDKNIKGLSRLGIGFRR